jgi:hypothetical protein
MTAELLSLGRVTFEVDPAVVPSAPPRADIACFVGFVARRPTPVPEGTRRWLERRGWVASLGEGGGPPDARLLDVPVPIESWGAFVDLFDWSRRPVQGGGVSATYLGAAVRSFFAQGGRRCYVVRVGDPVPLGTPRVARAPLTGRLRGLRDGVAPVPYERTSWRGLGHLFGLPDVSLLCLPDLPDLVGADPAPGPEPVPVPPALPAFEECSAVELPAGTAVAPPPLEAARLNEAQFAEWAGEIHAVASLLRRALPEVQLIAAVPLPARDTTLESGLADFLAREFLNRSLDAGGLGTSFAQLAYPWAVSAGSAGLPEGIEPPDGLVAGMVARAVLLHGAHRTAAGPVLRDVHDLRPRLDSAALAVDDRRGRGLSVLPDRIATLAPTVRGLELVSDTTPALDEAYRPAAVHRLVAIVIRGVRQVGEALVWEPAGERLWAELRHRVSGLLEALWAHGALEGGSSDEAYTVRCDRSTMTEADRESGRVLVEVQFTAAAPIARITVTLAMDESGQVTLLQAAEVAA